MLMLATVAGISLVFIFICAQMFSILPWSSTSYSDTVFQNHTLFDISEINALILISSLVISLTHREQPSTVREEHLR